LVPSEEVIVMPATVTLKNIPDTVYLRLKEAANAHHRSLNSEVIACLERVLLPTRLSPDERLVRARQLREGLTPGGFRPEDIAEAIRQGRP
jgi:plasmid stability protein